MKWTDKGPGDFEVPEEGSYTAVCMGVIDLGTQTSEFQGETTSARKVALLWELEEKTTQGKPFLMAGIYTQSLHEKANLRKILDSWMGSDLQADPSGFDAKTLLGKGCLLSVIHKNGKGRVSSVGKLPKNLSAPVMSKEPIYFSLNEFSQEKMDGLSKGWKRMIEGSPEYKEIHPF